MKFYRAINCSGCPISGICHNQKTERIVSVSHIGFYLKRKARERLESDIGKYFRKKCPTEAEPVFGNIKNIN